MSVQGGRRPPQGGLVRKPRGDRAADQLELNGGLVRTDNSDTLYKAILLDLLTKDTGRELTWALALETLDERPFSERREILVEATLVWCGAVMGLANSFGGSTAAKRAAVAVVRRLRILSGKRRVTYSGGAAGCMGVPDQPPALGREAGKQHTRPTKRTTRTSEERSDVDR